MPVRLIEHLERAGVLAGDGARQARDRQRRLGGSLDTCLLELSLVSESALTDALEQAYGIKTATPPEVTNPLDDRALRVFPEPWAKKHLLAPVAFDPIERSVTVLSAPPPDLDLLTRLGALLELELRPILALEFRVHQRLALLYGLELADRFRSLVLRSGGPPDAAAPTPSEIPFGAPPAVTFREALARLKEARTRDEIVRVALAYAVHDCAFSAMFVVHDERLEGWAAAGGNGTESVLGLALSLREESAFRSALEAKTHFVGPLEENASHRALFERMRRAPPREALIVPIRIRKKTIALLYADQGPQRIAENAPGDLTLFANHVESALEALLLRRKAEALSETRRPSGVKADAPPPVLPPESARVTDETPKVLGRITLVEAPRETSPELGTDDPHEDRTPLLSERAMADLRRAAIESMSSAGREAGAPTAGGVPTTSPAAPAGPASDSAPTLWTHRTHAARSILPGILVPPPPEQALTAFDPTPVVLAGRDLHADLVLPGREGPAPGALEAGIPPRRKSAYRAEVVEADTWERWAETHASKFEGSADGHADGAGTNGFLDGATRPGAGDRAPRGLELHGPANAGPGQGARLPRSAFPPEEPVPLANALPPRVPANPERTAKREDHPLATPGYAPVNPPAAASIGERHGSLFDRRDPELAPEEGHYEKGIDAAGRIVPFAAPAPSPAPRIATPQTLPGGPTRLDADVDRLIERALNGDPRGRRAAGEALVAIGPHVLPKVMERFPGPLSVDLLAPALPPFAACGELLAILQRFGLDAHSHVSKRLESPIPVNRFFATYFYSAVFVPSVIPRLSQRLHDEEPRISVLAARTLLGYRETHEFNAVLDHLHGRLESGPLTARRHAAHLVGFFRDARAVPILIGILDRKERALFDAVENALADITKQRFGQSSRKWRSWWEKHARRPRIAWLIDALSSKDSVMRRSAAEELRVLTGLDLGYDEEAPRKERDEARSRWIKWWSEQEGARPERGD